MKILLPISVLLIFFGLFACDDKKSAEKEDAYVARYDSIWPEIDSLVRKSWLKYYVVQTHDDPVYKLPYPAISFSTGTLMLFYWDTYFINEGILSHPENAYMAKTNIDNLLFQVEKIGYVPNCNFQWGRTRSQPPYLSQMVRSYYEKAERDNEWLKQSYFTLKKEYNFWMDGSDTTLEDNTTTIPGLNRYFHHSPHADLVAQYGELVKRFGFPDSIPEVEKAARAIPFAVEAETGMDFTPRFENHCQDFVAVDLNSNLYVYEKNFAWIVAQLDLRDEPNWDSLASVRKALVNKYCWNQERGLYMDYDFVHNKHSSVAAATTFSPLYAGLADSVRAARVVKNLDLFEKPTGIATVEENAEKMKFMWGKESAWAPMHYIVIAGLDTYGYKNDAKRIANKFLDLVAKNYTNPVPATYKEMKDGKESVVKRNSGGLFEKYKVTDGGSINDDEYTASEMIGWSAGVFGWAYKYVQEQPQAQK